MAMEGTMMIVSGLNGGNVTSPVRYMYDYGTVYVPPSHSHSSCHWYYRYLPSTVGSLHCTLVGTYIAGKWHSHYMRCVGCTVHLQSFFVAFYLSSIHSPQGSCVYYYCPTMEQRSADRVNACAVVCNVCCCSLT